MRLVDTIVVHHTDTRDGVVTWQQIRDYHVNVKGWQDIGYHYGIVHTGTLWVIADGRPADVVGAHCLNHNQGSIGIACEGNYSEVVPSSEMLGVLLALLFQLCRWYSVPAHRVFGHRELGSTECPGNWMNMDMIRARLSDALASPEGQIKR